MVPKFINPEDPDPDDPIPDDPEPDDPKTKIESDPLNLKLSDMINRASKNNGYSVIKFTDYDGNDCLTRDNLRLLDENPNAVLVLDYTRPKQRY